MREHIAAKLGKDLASDVFPDHSALDVPVADVPTSLHESSKPVGDSLDHEALPDNLHADVSFLDGMESPGGLGSNNWVINGVRTKSGKPLLANDPHLGHSVPSIWYMIHLKAPGLNVTGVSLPGLPLVIIGHNEHIAWGVTNTAPDVQDLYVESFNVHDPRKYLHNGQWVDAEVRDEVIKSSQQARLPFYRHGHAARTGHFARRRPRPCLAMDIAQPARGRTCPSCT